NIWLSQFTKKAVEEQKAKLELASQLSKLTNIAPSKSGLEKSLPNSSGSDSSMGTRPLSEIMQYINEKSGPGSSFMQRNKRYSNTPTDPTSAEVGKKKKKNKT